MAIEVVHLRKPPLNQRPQVPQSPKSNLLSGTVVLVPRHFPTMIGIRELNVVAALRTRSQRVRFDEKLPRFRVIPPLFPGLGHVGQRQGGHAGPETPAALLETFAAQEFDVRKLVAEIVTMAALRVPALDFARTKRYDDRGGKSVRLRRF